MVVALVGCQMLGLGDEPDPPRPAHLEGRAESVLTYPSLHTVPPLPQLSYPVEQQREIVERLISDREHARYTDQRIRYESGLSSLPPPPAPPESLADASAEVNQIVPAAPASPASPAAPAPTPQATPSAPAPGSLYSDDDSLDDVMQDLMRDTAPPAAAGRPAAAPAGVAPEAATPTEQEPAEASAAAPPQDEARSLGDRLFGWIGDLFGDEAPAEAAPPPSGEGTSPPDVVAEPAASGATAPARPLLKPTPVALPPRPSPLKPQAALAAGSTGPDARRPHEARIVPVAGTS
jgi:hypothetical protein